MSAVVELYKKKLVQNYSARICESKAYGEILQCKVLEVVHRKSLLTVKVFDTVLIQPSRDIECADSTIRGLIRTIQLKTILTERRRARMRFESGSIAIYALVILNETEEKTIEAEDFVVIENSNIKRAVVL